MEDIKATSSALETELYFLIARFLSAGPCTEAAKVLLREITENRLLPKRCDWLGKEHDRTYANLVESHPQIGPDHLLQICQRLGPLLDKEIPPVVKGIGSLLGAGKQSLLRTPEVLQQTKWKWKTFSVLRHQKMLTPPVNLQQPCSLIHLTSAMQQVGTVNPSLVRSSQHYSKLNLRCRSLGHLSAVYCVLFDKTGAFIITGADDHLVKIWSVLTGRLLVSLRGHSLEITDMAINHENTLLATGSCDKTIRVWDLNTGAPRQVLLAHTGSIASLQFCPLVRGENRYLLSTGADACVCFWVWNTITCDFNAKPIKFIERSRAGAQMLGSSFSPGGIFLATGNSDNVIRVYCLSTHAPEKICELEAHTDRVDSVQYANLSDRFISGGKDGYAKIWSFDRQQWKAISLNVAMQLGDTPEEASARPKLCVNMVAWSAHDHFVITSISDFSIKVWHSETGKLEHVMKGHTDEGFVLETHPVDPYILLSSGHDGNIIIWDIRNGSMLKKYFNHIDGQGYGCILDTKWSPDGLSLAATDSHGYYINVGYGSSERYKQIPDEYFFHTDYRPLIRDSSNFVLDEQTQQPPHLMPPPFLVDVDGNPHPPELQRLVPGREKCKIGELVPQIGVAPNGEREVLDIAVGAEPEGEPALPSPALEVVQPSTSSQPSGLQAADSQPSTSATTPTSTGPDPGPSTSTASGLDNSADTSVNLLSVNTSSVGESSERSYRPSIDDLIERMQADQDERMVAEGILPSPPLRSPAGPLSPVHRPRRPSSAVESVRHSVNTVPAPQQPCNTRPVKCKRRYIIPPTSPNSLRQREELQVCLAEEETSRFLQERKRQPFPGSEDSSDSANVYIRTRQHRRGGRGGRRRRSGLVETGRNRLTTRALYDSDVEEEEEAATYDTPFEISEDEHKEIAEIDEQEEEIWSSDRNTTSDSSDYSDWQADNQRSGTLQPPKRTSSRKVRRRHLSTTTEEEVDLEEDDVLPEPQPTPEAPKVRRNLQRKKGKRKVTAQSKILDRRKDLKELPEAFRPPEWLTDTMPRKSPFVPQMGDEVVYFRQGHEQYLKVVEQRKAYKVNHEKNQPWHKYPNLREHEFMQIVGIKYEVKPPRLVCLKLKFLNPVDDQPDTFSIKYHDMPDVIDFIVLKQNYDTSVKRNWKVGSRFRCMIDDAWWLGQIVEHLPFQDYFPDSLFQCFYIVWDNTEQERLSPWDLEPVNQTRLPRQGGSLPVLESELHAVMYKPGPHEWPKCGKEAEQLRIAQGLSQIMELAVAEHFLAPVDATKYPAYYVIVEYPMDLNTIKSRVENHYYRRITSMLYDVRFLEANSCKFNEPSSDIVKKAKIVTELCLRFIQDTSLQDPMMIYTELTRNVAESHNSGSDTDEQPQQSATTRNRHRAISMSAQELSDPDAWKGHCIQLLDNLLASDDSTPFRQPVNMDEYPDYAQRIKEPMDLGFIQEQLLENCYESPTDLARDIRLVFTNSKTYNLNKRSRIYTMTLRLSVMFEQQFPEILEQYNKALKHNRSSRKSRYKKKSSPSRLTRSSAQQPSTSTISSRPFPRASANMIRSLVVNNVAPSVPSGSSSSYINGHQSSSPDPGTRKKRVGLEYKPEPVSANSRKIEPHQNSYKATKRKRRVLSSDDAEKTEEDVPEEFQGEADEDDIDSDSDYEQPSRTGKRPPPARKVRAARPIPPKKRKRRVCYVEGESNESFDHTSDSDYKDEPLPLRKKNTKRYINNNRKGFVADDDSDDLEQGADVLSDASDYSDSPQTRGKKKTAPRYVLKPTANTRAVNTRTSKSLQSNGHTASDRSLRRTARSSRLRQEKASSDGTEDDETDIDTEEESTEHSDSNTETEGTSNSDTDQSPVRYESRRRRAVPKASADLMAPSASSANRGRSLTHRRGSRKQYSGSSAGSSPRRPPRRRNMGTVNYNESFDEPVRTRRAVNYDESDEESDDGGEHVSISSRGRVRKPTTRARAVSNIFY